MKTKQEDVENKILIEAKSEVDLVLTLLNNVVSSYVEDKGKNSKFPLLVRYMIVTRAVGGNFISWSADLHRKLFERTKLAENDFGLLQEIKKALDKEKSDDSKVKGKRSKASSIDKVGTIKKIPTDKAVRKRTSVGGQKNGKGRKQ